MTLRAGARRAALASALHPAAPPWASRAAHCAQRHCRAARRCCLQHAACLRCRLAVTMYIAGIRQSRSGRTLLTSRRSRLRPDMPAAWSATTRTVGARAQGHCTRGRQPSGEQRGAGARGRAGGGAAGDQRQARAVGHRAAVHAPALCGRRGHQCGPPPACLGPQPMRCVVGADAGQPARSAGGRPCMMAGECGCRCRAADRWPTRPCVRAGAQHAAQPAPPLAPWAGRARARRPQRGRVCVRGRPGEGGHGRDTSPGRLQLRLLACPGLRSRTSRALWCCAVMSSKWGRWRAPLIWAAPHRTACGDTEAPP